MRSTESQAMELADILPLSTDPVAVFFLNDVPDALSDWERLNRHRYCQALMEARHGASVLLEKEELSCPAAAAAFGFRSLPKSLATGDGLVGFGIVHEAATGKAMFDGMPRLDSGCINALALCPLRKAPKTPDVVVLEDEPEPLMWFLLADLNVAQGARRYASTAVLQATCVDATVIPYKEQRLSFSLGCYGCREATDLGTNEVVLGFPGDRLEPLIESLKLLAAKAIPRSRAKAALKNLKMKREAAPCSEQRA